MSKKVRPPVEFDITWTKDETNTDGNEPSKKLLLDLAQELGRVVARRDMAQGVKERDPASLKQAMSSTFEELFASATLRTTDAPKPNKK